MFDKNGFFLQFVRLAGPYWNSEEKSVIRRDTVMLIVLTVLQMVMAVVITEWNAALFDALEQHSMAGVLKQVGFLLVIFLASIGITTLHLLVKRRILIGWRLWLTEKVSAKWMSNGRHYQVKFMGKNNHDNPDGRIAEDIRIATEDAVAMAHSLFYSLLLLVSFTKILWTLSGRVALNLGLTTVEISGYLVWLAILYSILASWLGWWTGKPLTSSTDERQTEEANYRHELIIAQENSQAIALLKGEKQEQERLLSSFQGIIQTYALQTAAWKQIQIFQSGYSVVSMALPILVAAPRYIANAISLGALMQSVQAFQQMASALSWPVNNMPQIAKWRTSVERVIGLVTALDDLDDDIACGIENQICLGKLNQPIVRLDNVRIGNMRSNERTAPVNLEIKSGEHVLIVGKNGNGARLFQAIAGLWPWGEGHIFIPQGNRLFFMPPKPYLPRGTLYQAICYPNHPRDFEQPVLIMAMEKAGLDELVNVLDEIDNWEETLGREQQQRLGVVRVLLHQPQWIFIQEALDSLNANGESAMLTLLANELPQSAIIYTTNQTVSKALNYRTVNL